MTKATAKRAAKVLAIYIRQHGYSVQGAKNALALHEKIVIGGQDEVTETLAHILSDRFR